MKKKNIYDLIEELEKAKADAAALQEEYDNAETEDDRLMIGEHFDKYEILIDSLENEIAHIKNTVP